MFFLPSCGSLLSWWREAWGEMPGSFGMEGERVHVLDQCPDFPCKTTGPTSPSSASLWQRYAERPETGREVRNERNQRKQSLKETKGWVRRGKWKLYTERMWEQTEDGERAKNVTETIYFSLTARVVFVWVLVSSADICQPTTPNYCPPFPEKQTHSRNARMKLRKGYFSSVREGLYYLLLRLLLRQVCGFNTVESKADDRTWHNR